MQPLSPLPEALRRAESFERKRERERERDRRRRRSKLQLARRWVGCGGVAGRVKGTWDFGTKPTYLMQFSQVFVFYGPDPVAIGDKELEPHLSRKRSAKHFKP